MDNYTTPILLWTEGVPVEDEAMKQLENVASLPFVQPHVAVMPDVHWGRGATIGSVIPCYGAIIPAAVGVDIGCFRGDTKIPLLDGTQQSIANLIGKHFWVYSCTTEGQVVPGKATALMTRQKASLVKVIVSGGDEIICTPDHKFMLLDGSYCEAQNLRFNQSLMPLYRRWQSRDGYESCAAGNGRYRVTHELIYEKCFGFLKNKHVIHHKNINHFDNRPENLESMTASEHSALHRGINNNLRNSDPDFQKRRIAGIAKRKADPVSLAKMISVGTDNIKNYMRDRPDHYSESVSGNGKRGAHFLKAFNTSPRKCSQCSHIANNPAALQWHKKREHDQLSNHKVISVITLDEVDDVYCLQVETYHNFALSAGVFVHNCGMLAVETSLTANQLPDNLSAIRSAIEAAVPHGRSHNGNPNRDVGAWSNPPEDIVDSWNSDTYPYGSLAERFELLTEKYPKLANGTTAQHLGTLGTGNHFIELCLDERDHVWIMLHTGSRGVGNRIGNYFIEQAKKVVESCGIELIDKDLAYLVEGSGLFHDYVTAVEWAQNYAFKNRSLIFGSICAALDSQNLTFSMINSVVNCHHNYISKEHHYGKDLWVTRKGAVSAKEGELAIIPGSMGAKSFIVRGKGNQKSFCSCSHGAGRAMSRGEAKRRFTVEDHAIATAHVECRKDLAVVDETPMAYKNIDMVMSAQADLVDIVHTLRQVLCVKG